MLKILEIYDILIIILLIDYIVSYVIHVQIEIPKTFPSSNVDVSAITKIKLSTLSQTTETQFLLQSDLSCTHLRAK